MIDQFAVCDASLHGLVAKGPCSHPVGSPTFFPPTRWWGKVRVVFEGSDWRWEKEKDLVKRRVDPELVRSITFFGVAVSRNPAILLAIGLAQYSTANCHLSTPRPSPVIRLPSLLYLPIIHSFLTAGLVFACYQKSRTQKIPS